MLTRSAMLACALATPVLSQVTATLQTETAVGVAANYQAASLPAGTSENGLRNLSVRDRGDIFFGPAQMDLGFSRRSALHRRLTWLGVSSKVNLSPFVGLARTRGNSGEQEQSLLWTLQGSGAGTLLVDTSASISNLPFPPYPTSNVARIGLDVGADGTPDFQFDLGRRFQLGQRAQIPVAFPGGGGAVPIRITAEFRVGGEGSSTSYSSTMTCDLSFVPGVLPADVTEYGSDCGARLVGADSVATGQHSLTFELHDALPDETAAFVFGSRQAALPIGVSGCILHVEPVGVVFTTADALGFASTGFVLPAPISGATAFVQAFSLETGTGQGNEDWEATQGLRIDFGDPR